VLTNKLPHTGLSESDIDQILSTVTKQKRISKIILFGSRAKGSYTPGSDIDLALSGANLVTDDLLDTLVNLDELNLPYKFDLILLERIKEQDLLDHINRVGIILFDKHK
jgi:predicted nucleotidyltransferase